MSVHVAKKAVHLHSHDFDWEELAQRERMKEEAPAALLFSSSPPLAMDADEAEDEGDSSEQELATIAKARWDAFHARNNGKVYKPRNYLLAEFPELDRPEQAQVRVLEVGCGYGSAIFPILAECRNVLADVCDFSAHAISILQRHQDFDPTRCHAFVCDITTDELARVGGLADESMDVVLLVFVLSAVPPSAVSSALGQIARVLKPGGVICFRDYGLYDLAMRRNAKQLSPSLFYRSDGTLAYFFSREDIVRLFQEELRFHVLENEYCTVRLRNRKKNVTMDRVWLHAKCQKPREWGSTDASVKEA